MAQARRGVVTSLDCGIAGSNGAKILITGVFEVQNVRLLIEPERRSERLVAAKCRSGSRKQGELTLLVLGVQLQ